MYKSLQVDGSLHLHSVAEKLQLPLEASMKHVVASVLGKYSQHMF